MLILKFNNNFFKIDFKFFFKENFYNASLPDAKKRRAASAHRGINGSSVV